MTELTTIDPNNYGAMAKAMGIANEAPAKAKSSSLARLRINHSPIMGTAEVKGKSINVETVSGGTYKLEIPDGDTYFANSVKLRPHMQRFMYKRFVMGGANAPNRYVKTIMSDNLNVDLKDNDGGFNCGKPAGFIQDFKSLPEKMQDLIKQIKRVRVLFGTVELVNPVSSTGAEVPVDPMPFIWEIDNRDAFKIVGEPFANLAKLQRLPIHHMITATTDEKKLPNGNSFYVTKSSLDVANKVKIVPADEEHFVSFQSWIQGVNQWVIGKHNELAHNHEGVDKELVESFIDITSEGKVQ